MRTVRAASLHVFALARTRSWARRPSDLQRRNRGRHLLDGPDERRAAPRRSARGSESSRSAFRSQCRQRRRWCWLPPSGSATSSSCPSPERNPRGAWLAQRKRPARPSRAGRACRCGRSSFFAGTTAARGSPRRGRSSRPACRLRGGRSCSHTGSRSAGPHSGIRIVACNQRHNDQFRTFARTEAIPEGQPGGVVRLHPEVDLLDTLDFECCGTALH